MRYTDMQWYMSHARNTVHLVALFPDRLEKAQLLAMLAQTLETLPTLMQADLPSQGGTRRALIAPQGPMAVAEAVLTCHELVGPGDNPAAYLEPVPDLFDDPTLPALRVRFWSARQGTAPDAGSPASVLSLAISHALIEGADLSALLRDGRIAARRAVTKRFGVMAHLGLALGAPLMAMMHLAMARREKRRREDFGFALVEIDGHALRSAARLRGLRRRSLLFGCLLHTLCPGATGSRLHASYSHMPMTSVIFHDDSRLSVRVNDLMTRRTAHPEALAHKIEAMLRARDEDALLTQFMRNRVLAWHRRFIRIVPGLYGGALFGYAPYDLVLSLVHPLRPNGGFAALGKARLFGGSMTGTAPSCIMLQSSGRLTACLWMEKTQMARLQALCDAMAALDVPCTAVTPTARFGAQESGPQAPPGMKPASDKIADPIIAERGIAERGRTAMRPDRPA